MKTIDITTTPTPGYGYITDTSGDYRITENGPWGTNVLINPSISTGSSFTYTYTSSDVEAFKRILEEEHIMPTKMGMDYTSFIKYVKEGKEGAVGAAPSLFIDRLNKSVTAKEKANLLVKKIIVNGPATIVFWADDSKTVVKANGEAFDIEKALAMAFIKRLCKNNGWYIEVLHKILKENDLDWDVGKSEGDK